MRVEYSLMLPNRIEEAMRLIFVDTETTGLSPNKGDRIVEVACVEVIDNVITGRTLHHVINPERDIPVRVSEIHGIANEAVTDKPKFRDIADQLIEFVGDAEVVMHNAKFDTSFFACEFGLIGKKHAKLIKAEHAIDTLKIFREKGKGEKSDLSSLCARYSLQRDDGEEWHGALNDARMLARLWIAAGLSLD